MAKKKLKKEKAEFEIVDKLNGDDFFDDCPICRAMKAAKEQGREPTISELREAFKKAKENGAIVGGEWFEKSKNSKKNKNNQNLGQS